LFSLSLSLVAEVAEATLVVVEVPEAIVHQFLESPLVALQRPNPHLF
jgi:hypothetical protein